MTPHTPGDALFSAELLDRSAHDPAALVSTLRPAGIPPEAWLLDSAERVLAQCRFTESQAHPAPGGVWPSAFDGVYNHTAGPVDHRLWPEHQLLRAVPDGYFYLRGAAVSTGGSTRAGHTLISNLAAAGWVLRVGRADRPHGGAPRFVPHLALPHPDIRHEAPNATRASTAVLLYPASIPLGTTALLTPPWAPAEEGLATARALVQLLRIGAEGREAATKVYAVGGEPALNAYLRSVDSDSVGTSFRRDRYAGVPWRTAQDLYRR